MGKRQFGWLWVVISVISISVAGSAFAADSAGVSSSSDKVNLELRDIDVKSAIEALFRNTGKNFAIDPNVSGVIPSLSFKDVGFDLALKNLTKTSGLTYRLDQEIYIISKKPEIDTSPIDPNNQPDPFIPDEPAVAETQIEKIPLNFSSAAELLAMMNGTYNTSGGYGGGYGGSGGYGGMMGGYGGGGMMSGMGGMGGMGGMSGFGGMSGMSGMGGFGGMSSMGGMGGGFGGMSMGGGYGRGW